jgi:hypothetical protein
MDLAIDMAQNFGALDLAVRIEHSPVRITFRAAALTHKQGFPQTPWNPRQGSHLEILITIE